MTEWTETKTDGRNSVGGVQERTKPNVMEKRKDRVPAGGGKGKPRVVTKQDHLKSASEEKVKTQAKGGEPAGHLGLRKQNRGKVGVKGKRDRLARLRSEGQKKSWDPHRQRGALVKEEIMI